MASQTGTVATSFVVHHVDRATEALPICKTHDAIRALIGGKVESCCDFTDDCITKVHFQPVLAAVHYAFSQHRPLVLSADMIWITIVQGLAQHIKNNAEKLRNKFVQHDGKLAITVKRDDFVPRSPENPWASVIDDFSAAIKNHLGATYDDLISNFSTTGPVERTACEVALLDAFQPYFEYIFVGICGIPEITLEGTTEDWRKLRAKVDHLQRYDLEWWLPSVRDICDHFVRASEGDVDLDHWQDIYKRQLAYGWDLINGWIVQLIPYVKNHSTGNFTLKNPLLHKADDKGISTNSLPSGIAQVPFRWETTADVNAMEFLGGFVGVTQDSQTLALRPKLGWAVQRASDFDQLLLDLAKHEPTPPLAGPDFDQVFAKDVVRHCELPGDLLSFYKHCNGVTILAKDGGVSFRPLASTEIIEKLEVEGHPPKEIEGGIKLRTGPWFVFADLEDDGSAAVELSHTYDAGSGSIRWKVIHIATDQKSHALIAWSFTEFLATAMQKLC